MPRTERQRRERREFLTRLLDNFETGYKRLHADILNVHVQLRLLDQEDEEARRLELDLHLVPGSELKVGDLVEITNADHNQDTIGVVFGATRDNKIKVRTPSGQTIRRAPTNLLLLQE